MTIERAKKILLTCDGCGVKAKQAAIQIIESDVLMRAALICEANKQNWGAAYNDIMSEIRIINENVAEMPNADLSHSPPNQKQP